MAYTTTKVLKFGLLALLSVNMQAQPSKHQQRGSSVTSNQQDIQIELISEPGKPSLITILRKQAPSEPTLITDPCSGSIGECEQATVPPHSTKPTSVQPKAGHQNLAQVIAH